MLKDLKGVMNNSTIIVEDSSNPLMSMDISYIKKINKETSALNSILEKIDNKYLTGHSVQKQQNTHSFPLHVERFPR